MRALVTGAAGFVGSHLAATLLDAGDEVVGVDALTDFYPRERKLRNLGPLEGRGGWSFVEGDLLELDLPAMLRSTDTVFHLAGQPGVRPSWGRGFGVYTRENVLATQAVLEAAKDAALGRLVYASSSSVYGNAESYPTAETARPQPVSPYGVTKLAAEHLCELYRSNFGVPTASLRLFTVYGPRQRPDMAFARLVEAATGAGRFELYGDGTQTRDFTYVGDVVRAMRDCAVSGWTGVANIGGGSRVSMNEVIDTVQEVVGAVDVRRTAAQAGDVRDTAADITVARDAFGYAPTTGIRDGLLAMRTWLEREAVVA